MQVPDGWQVVRLGDVCTPPEYGAAAASIPYAASLPRYVRITDITDDGRLRVEDKRSADPRQVEGYHLEDGDLLFARSGSVGRTYLYQSQDGPCVFAGYLIRFCPLPDQAIPEYLEHWTHSDSYYRWIASVARRGAQTNINAAEYSSLPILLPPLSEQQAIAAVLDSIDDAIERTEAVITATERVRDALLHELLTRGVPGWHTQWKDVPGIGTIPAAWDVVRLGDVVTIASGQSDPKEAKFQDSLFVAPDDIESGTGRLINRRTVAEAHAISGKYRFDKFEVLYSKIRPYLMKVYRPHESGLCSADIYPLRPKSMLEAAYLALVLLSLSFTDYTRTCSDRTGIPKINRIDLFKYRLTLPSLPEQRTIAAVLGGVDGAITRAWEECDMLRSLKEATADALLTGRVPIGVLV